MVKSPAVDTSPQCWSNFPPSYFKEEEDDDHNDDDDDDDDHAKIYLIKSMNGKCTVTSALCDAENIE